VERYVINKWDQVAGRDTKLDDGHGMPAVWKKVLVASELWQVKVWLKRKTPQVTAMERLLEELKHRSRPVPRMKLRKRHQGKRRALEVCLMDPHMGLRCYPPGADQAWSLDDCEKICKWAVDGLLELAEPYRPFEQIIFPFGNDFLHADNLLHTTTAGTPQPEAEAYQETYRRGVNLAVAMVDRLKEEAPVKVYQVPGNHDRQSAYTLGYVLWAYYHKDKNVSVDCSASPYKFHRYGTNLIGYEHGHSVSQIRLAALMANECREHWADTTYREWHLGDQHRKGSSKPSAMEEQGVSVEFLPGLTPPNEWHRLKAFNWQKRGAMAFVWDHDRGPVARLQVNLNSYTGRPTGEKRKRR
jgi:hypothetical protein